MKISSSAAAALLACTTTFTASAFVVPHQTPITASSRSVVSSLSSALSASTIKEASTATTTTTMTATSSASDNSSSSSSSNTEPHPLLPLTIWGDHILDILVAQQAMKQQVLPEFASEISAQTLGIAGTDATAVAAQLQYFQDNAATIKHMMETHGAVIFRDFDLMKTNAGFQQFYQAVGMKVCLDPLHSVSARPTVDGQKNSPVYEAVNKESCKNFFIALVPLMVFAIKWCLNQLAACGIIPDSWHQYFVQGLDSNNKKKNHKASCCPETTTSGAEEVEEYDDADVAAVSKIRSEPQWKALLDAHNMVVCKFTAEWCQPCHKVQPIFESLAQRQATEKSKPAIFCTMDVDALDHIASERYGIALLPTFVVFRNGKEIGRYAGGNEMKVRDFLDQHLCQ